LGQKRGLFPSVAAAAVTGTGLFMAAKWLMVPFLDFFLVSRLDPSNLQIPARRKTAGNCSVSQKNINLCTDLRRKACHERIFAN
jgi:hypothetical protein